MRVRFGSFVLDSEARQLERLFRRSNPRPTRAPGRRDQRALRRMKGIT